MIEGGVLSGVCLRKICLRNICVIPGNRSRKQTQVRCKPFELFIATLCLIHRWWVRCLRPNIEACGKCGEVLDVYGDHAVTCKRNNFHTRHQLVVDALASVLTSADLPLDMEVAINWKEGPADIPASRLKGSSPLAIDVTVVHPFTQTSDTLQHDRVSSAELAKHRHYDELCRSS